MPNRARATWRSLSGALAFSWIRVSSVFVSRIPRGIILSRSVFHCYQHGYPSSHAYEHVQPPSHFLFACAQSMHMPCQMVNVSGRSAPPVRSRWLPFFTRETGWQPTLGEPKRFLSLFFFFFSPSSFRFLSDLIPSPAVQACRRQRRDPLLLS